MSRKKLYLLALPLAVTAALTLSACTSAGEGADMDENAAPPAAEETMAPDTGMDAAANLVGPGCADYAEAVPDGPGSVEGMSADPVATAASNNPLLTTLVSAVSGQLNSDVDLVDTLNGDEFTVFAPVDEAFGKIDAATIETLKTDADMLTSILTYHVVPGQIAPDAIAGMHTTVNGAELEVTGSGDDLMVNGESTVICGGVQTANSTVYLIDTVLLPPM